MAVASPNFSFLVGQAQLVRLGSLAERYFREDGNTALIKLRQFGEVLAQTIAAKVGQYRGDTGQIQLDLLRRLEDRGAIPRDAAKLFYELRVNGNKAIRLMEKAIRDYPMPRWRWRCFYAPWTIWWGGSVLSNCGWYCASFADQLGERQVTTTFSVATFLSDLIEDKCRRLYHAAHH